MRVLLCTILAEVDNNNSSTDKATFYKWVDLFMAPEQETSIKMVDGSSFYITTLIQDLSIGYIVLLHNRKIHYRDCWRGKLDDLINEYKVHGWSDEIPM